MGSQYKILKNLLREYDVSHLRANVEKNIVKTYFSTKFQRPFNKPNEDEKPSENINETISDVSTCNVIETVNPNEKIKENLTAQVSETPDIANNNEATKMINTDDDFEKFQNGKGTANIDTNISNTFENQDISASISKTSVDANERIERTEKEMAGPPTKDFESNPQDVSDNNDLNVSNTEDSIDMRDNFFDIIQPENTSPNEKVAMSDNVVKKIVNHKPNKNLEEQFSSHKITLNVIENSTGDNIALCDIIELENASPNENVGISDNVVKKHVNHKQNENLEEQSSFHKIAPDAIENNTEGNIDILIHEIREKKENRHFRCVSCTKTFQNKND